MRLFIAIEFPDEIKRLLSGLRADIPGARWVPREQLHLTLAFLGEVDEVALKLLVHELEAIQTQGFVLRFDGTGCFPNRHRPRVLWVGLGPEPRLTGLAAMVYDAVKACAIPQEERPFSPHITLARLKQPAARESGVFLDLAPMPEIPPVMVEAFVLFQSRLTSQGAVHTPVRAFPLIPPQI